MILTEKISNPVDALNYVRSLSLEEKLTLFRKYGPYFVKCCSKEFLTALKEITSADDIVIESPGEESATRRVQFIDGDESESHSTKLNIQEWMISFFNDYFQYSDSGLLIRPKFGIFPTENRTRTENKLVGRKFLVRRKIFVGRVWTK